MKYNFKKILSKTSLYSNRAIIKQSKTNSKLKFSGERQTDRQVGRPADMEIENYKIILKNKGKQQIMDISLFMYKTRSHLTRLEVK